MEVALHDRIDVVNCGELVLDEIRTFMARFVTFPSPAVLDAVTLWIAHTHVVDGCGRLGFETSPRIAFLSDEPASGKTTALEMVTRLANRGRISIDMTAPGLAISIAEKQGTIGLDELDVLFGAGGAKSVLRSLLNAGYKRGATWTRKANDDLPIFGPVAMAGLAKKWRSATALSPLRSRTIEVEMRRGRGPAERYRPRLHDALSAELRGVLSKWAARYAPLILEDWPSLPEGVTDRDEEVWEPLFMVANAAGGHWPASVERACRELVLGESTVPDEPTVRMRLLADLRWVFGEAERMTTVQIVAGLHGLPGSEWKKLWPNPATAPRELSLMLGEDVSPIKVRVGEQSLRGYSRKDLEPLWAAVPGVPGVFNDGLEVEAV
jgi:hypothetical protein